MSSAWKCSASVIERLHCFRGPHVWHFSPFPVSEQHLRMKTLINTGISASCWWLPSWLKAAALPTLAAEGKEKRKRRPMCAKLQRDIPSLKLWCSSLKNWTPEASGLLNFVRLLIVEPAVSVLASSAVFVLLMSERMLSVSQVPTGTGTESVQNASCN